MKDNNLKKECHAELDSASISRDGTVSGSRNKFGMTGRSMFGMARGQTSLITLGMLSALFFATSSFAYTSCVGGTEITRNQYGASGAPTTCTAALCPVATANEPAKKFCKSDKAMNWWSAFNWCKSNGGTLASFASMCPGVQTSANNVTGACPALQSTSSAWVWSSMGYGSSEALPVNLSSGAVVTSGRNNGNSALCE